MTSDSPKETSASSADKSFYTYAINNQNALQRFMQLGKFKEHLDTGDGKALIIYKNPTWLLQDDYELQKDFLVNLAKWLEHAQQILPILRRHRRKTTVFEQVGAHDTHEVLSAFQSGFNNQMPPPQLTTPTLSDSALLRALAGLYVSQNAEIVRSIAELQASSVTPPKNLVPIPDATEIFQELRALQNEKTLVHDHLLSQLTELEGALEERGQKNKLLTQRLATTEKQLGQKADTLQTQLDLVYASTSWRISAPLRTVMRLLKR